MATKFSIFYPRSSRAILNDYPELARYDEIKSLPPKDIVFAWYYACKASPFYDMESETERIKASMYKAYPKDKVKKRWNNFQERKFGNELHAAIKRMSSFDPGARVQALMFTRKAFSNIQKLIDIPEDELEKQFEDSEGNVNWTKKKAYIDSVAQSQKVIPDMIRNLENAFGVVEDEEEQESEFDNFVEDWVNRKE